MRGRNVDGERKKGRATCTASSKQVPTGVIKRRGAAREMQGSLLFLPHHRTEPGILRLGEGKGFCKIPPLHLALA